VFDPEPALGFWPMDALTIRWSSGRRLTVNIAPPERATRVSALRHCVPHPTPPRKMPHEKSAREPRINAQADAKFGSGEKTALGLPSHRILEKSSADSGEQP